MTLVTFASILCPQFSVLYIVSLVAILAGFVMFNAVPTLTADPAPAPAPEEDGHVYQGSVFEVTSTEPVSVEGGEDGDRDRDPKGLTWRQPMSKQLASGEERGTRL